jgi:5'-phosphate synthase pdxT subunit
MINDVTKSERLRIGVLALQGDFAAHIAATEAAGASAFPVRTAEEVDGCDGLILPGGESTTIGRLLVRFGIDIAIHQAHQAGKPIYGTCAGMILLAKRIESGEKRGGQPTLGLMDISVVRNAFGRQIDSFEADIPVAREVAGGESIRGVFIRAPYIADAGPGVKILARFAGESTEEHAILARQGNLLVAAFHPELTGDTRLHSYFIGMVADAQTMRSDNR